MLITIKLFFYLILSGVMFLGCFPVKPVYAQNPGEDLDIVPILEIINQVRRDPLTHLADMGVEPARAFEDRPELETFLSPGMSVLENDPRLNQAAEYFAKAQLEGRAFQQDEIFEILQADFGFQAFSHGSASGLLLFENYIAPEQAYQILIKQIFKDELVAESPGRLTLLNPSLRKAGVFFEAITVLKNKRVVNGYLFRMEVASGPEFMVEGHLEMLVNGFRSDPVGMISALGLDLETIESRLGSRADVLSKIVPPLAWDKNLFETVLILAPFLAEHDLDAKIMKDIREVLGLYVETLGFNTEPVILLSSMITLDNSLALEEMASAILAEILMNEAGNSAIDPVLDVMQPGISEMAFRVLPVEFDQDQTKVIVLGLMSSPREQRFHVMGRIEGFSAVSWFFGHEMVQNNYIHARTSICPDLYLTGIDPLGRYQFRLFEMNVPYATMELTLEDNLNNISQTKRVILNNRNLLVDF